MNYFKIPLKLVSPLGTPLAADTLFGHIGWAIAYHNGDAALTDFLKKYEQEPPLILSDPFPKGFLPVPVLQNIANTAKDTAEFDANKKARKAKFIESDWLLKNLGNVSNETLLEHLKDTKSKPATKHHLVPHNAVDRIAGGTIEGQLFFTDDEFVNQNGAEFDLYAASPNYDAAKIKTLLGNALEGGYGRDKSTGRGKIEIGHVELFTLPKVEKPNAALLLSPCIPAKDDPTNGFWNIKSKTGKLGGDWAIITKNPFKKTLLMLQSGSVFITETVKPFYGRLADAHSSLPVKHYGLTLTLPMFRTDTTEF